MKIAGGIIALIAGVFGIFAAGATLMLGGIGDAMDVQDAGTIVGLGWGGVLFSFLVIVLGAVSLGVNSKKVGTALIVASILGIFLGGTLVALFMLLALVGGILVTVGASKAEGAIVTVTPTP